MGVIGIIGRSPSGLAEWLRKHKLKVPPPEWLADKTADWIKAVQSKKMDEAEKILNEIVDYTGAKGVLRDEVEREILRFLITSMLLAIAIST